jgi:hypothetical protein
MRSVIDEKAPRKEMSIAPELTFGNSNGWGTNLLSPLAGVHYILPKEPSLHSHKEKYSAPRS